MNLNYCDRCEEGGYFTHVSSLSRKMTLHQCFLLQASSVSSVCPRSSPPHGTIRYSNSYVLYYGKFISFWVTGSRTEARGTENAPFREWEAPITSLQKLKPPIVPWLVTQSYMFSLKPYSHGISITWWPLVICNNCGGFCDLYPESAMSVICKVKTHHISPNTEVLW